MAHPIALITGASRGLGKQAALTLAARGVDLIITYRSQADEAAAVVAEATALGVKAHALPLDVADSSSFASFARQVQELLTWQRQQIDFLVNNAGIGIHATIEQTTEQQFDTLFNIHLKGCFSDATAAAASPRWRAYPQPVERAHPLCAARLCCLCGHEGGVEC